jgi:hypothetical protein
MLKCLFFEEKRAEFLFFVYRYDYRCGGSLMSPPDKVPV